MIEVEGLEVLYGAARVLRGVGMRLEPGCFCGILGPNGAGKSTLLRAIAALVEFSGRVVVGGRDVRRMGRREIARLLSLVPQEFPHELEFSAAELVEMGRYPHRRLPAGDERILRRALERVELLELKDRSFARMSSGERQRVLIARALAQEAEVLLLDEPTSSLDLRHSLRVMRLLRELAEEGRVVVASMHQVNLASLYCDMLVMLKKGRVVAEGTPEEVITPRRIREVYGCEVCVVEHPLTGKPQIVPVP